MLPVTIMSEQDKLRELKGRGRVSVEEINGAIREQAADGASQMSSKSDNSSTANAKALDDAQADKPHSQFRPSIIDMLHDSEGEDVNHDPPKLGIRFRLPKL